MRRGTVARVVLGAALRQHRMTGRSSTRLARAARRAGLTAAALSFVEQGLHPLDQGTLRGLLEVYGVHDPGERRALTHLLAAGEPARNPAGELAEADRADGAPIRDLGPGHIERLAGLEAHSTLTRAYTAALIPAPLRTRAYQAALASASARPLLGRRDSAAEADRPARPGQTALRQLLLDKAVLRRPVGGAHVMADQLEYLLHLSGRDLLTLRVLPLRYAPPTLGNALSVLTLPGHRDPLPLFESTFAVHYSHGTDAVRRAELLARAFHTAEPAGVSRHLVADARGALLTGTRRDPPHAPRIPPTTGAHRLLMNPAGEQARHRSDAGGGAMAATIPPVEHQGAAWCR
ncbi:hypothetical protein E0L36_23115 [Streptomyces sp. AJS327]|uniref:Scr1 family TA system antitoxin-like transcriptional regulator n=1 Tax=Streptomyces sp. AJS327 TaxID=2545265 RepID=UPI0015DE9568|nr:Scr1 family TA system antitoxin-like transcriptional regulator [Streptomyces sp. AJS327]MBA0053650.1 hypothetical protein [Streptomyces sp. AJS327]